MNQELLSQNPNYQPLNVINSNFVYGNTIVSNNDREIDKEENLNLYPNYQNQIQKKEEKDKIKNAQRNKKRTECSACYFA